jgi:hypothetical protein
MAGCGDADAAWGSTEQIRLEKENKTKQNKTNKIIEKEKRKKEKKVLWTFHPFRLSGEVILSNGLKNSLVP